MTASLAVALQEHDAVGWVRANEADQTKLLTDLNELRKQNELLKRQRDELVRAQNAWAIKDLAGLDEEYTLKGTYTVYSRHSSTEKTWEYRTTWLGLFCLIAPELMQSRDEGRAFGLILEKLKGRTEPAAVERLEIDHETRHTIRLQFLAHRLIECTGQTSIFWKLSQRGQQIMFRERTVKSVGSKQESA